jgi:hypothetical protein
VPFCSVLSLVNSLFSFPLFILYTFYSVLPFRQHFIRFTSFMTCEPHGPTWDSPYPFSLPKSSPSRSDSRGVPPTLILAAPSAPVVTTSSPASYLLLSVSGHTTAVGHARRRPLPHLWSRASPRPLFGLSLRPSALASDSGHHDLTHTSASCPSLAPLIPLTPSPEPGTNIWMCK